MLRSLSLLILFIWSTRAYSFPENIRHGYFNCTACHVSPSGGGVLTPYGRSISAELMSSWGTVKSAGFLFSDNEDENKNPPWFRANIFLRGVQIRRNSSAVEKAQFIPMQADLEGGIDIDRFAVILTGGFRAKDFSQSKDFNEFFSRRHYILYRLNDSWALRAGKFMFSFGLNGPDHITATRRGLGWDQGSETYNVEASFNGEKVSTIISVIDSAPEEKNIKKDKGVALNQSFFISEDSRIGVSAFIGGQDAYQRNVVGPYWIWSLSSSLFLDSEIFYQQKNITKNQESQNGYATFHRLGYEAIKGLIPFAQLDRSFLSTSEQTTLFDSYGVGVQWFPYPHFEALSFLGKEKAYGKETTDFWWLMLNIYL